MAAEDSPGLLVGQEAEDQVSRRATPRAGQVTDDGQHHRVHVLHVDRAAAPEAAVAFLAREGVDLPVGGVGRHHVEVPMDHQGSAFGRSGRVALDADHDARPAGFALEQLGFQADLGQQPHHVFGRLALPRPRAVTEVAGVDLEQVAAELDDLVLRAGLAHGDTLSAAPARQPLRAPFETVRRDHYRKRRRSQSGSAAGRPTGTTDCPVDVSRSVPGRRRREHERRVGRCRPGAKVGDREQPDRAAARPGGGIGRRASLRC